LTEETAHQHHERHRPALREARHNHPVARHAGSFLSRNQRLDIPGVVWRWWCLYERYD
jgi:hypothetical protein